MYQYVVFDLDGTLLNTLDDLADAGNWTCRQRGWPEHSLEKYKYFVGNGMARLVERFSPEEFRTPEQIQTTLDMFIPYYHAHKADKTAPYPGVPAMMERLKCAGIQMAVLTNKANELARPVVETYYPNVFSVVQGAVPGVPTKPDPTALYRLMERMGAVPRGTLFVGDSNVDICTAKNAGLDSCGVLWGFRTRKELEAEGATYFAETTEQLVELILET